MFVIISLKLAKIIEVCEGNFFSKINFNRFSTTTNPKIYTKSATSESSKRSILDKKFTLQTPIIFANFRGAASKKIFFKTKNGRVKNKKNLFLAITFEPLDNFFF